MSSGNCNGLARNTDMCGLSVLLVLAAAVTASVAAPTEEELTNYLQNDYETEASEMCQQLNEASWNYETDVNNLEKRDKLNEVTLQNAAFEKDTWEVHFRDADWQNFKDESVKRQLQFLSVLGQAALNSSSLTQLNNCATSMSSTYATAKICPYNKTNCDLAGPEAMDLDPGITAVMANSRDYDELKYVWESWHNESGKLMRSDYKLYVDLNNMAAKANGFEDMGQMWRNDFESDTFQEDMMGLWEQVKPLYDDLHTYVRRKLKAKYGDKMDDSDGLIPAHLLGNMWAQQWGNIFDIVKPFQNGSAVDITEELERQGYNVTEMFRTSDEFYQSLGLKKNDMSYGPKAMLERPTDGREVVCHASAWDFCNKTDFRIKMCTKINMEDFVVIHHEMGHIQYYLQYADLPYSLRKGANPGFHEAVGDMIALSVSTPKHLQKIGLLLDYEDSEENSINSLMRMALDKVAFLPFGLLIDMWRWDVFGAKVDESRWNARWWELREQYQKLKAPVPRSEDDFDPGAKYHVPADSQYISYFIAHILQFQLHRAVCISAGEYNPDNSTGEPLHKCDIYKSLKAGEKLAEGLKLGGSKHWKEALQALTGEDNYNGSALLEYFKPLQDYLKEQNSANEEVSQLIPIVVGCVLGALMIIVLIAYFLFRRRARTRA